MIREELGWLWEGGLLSAKQVQYMRGQDTPKEMRFYLLQKIHKDRATWPFSDVSPGRPIVLDCGSESYGVVEFITKHLGPLSTIHASYVRDTYDFLGTGNKNRSWHQSLLYGCGKPVHQHRDKEGTGGSHKMPTQISRGG